MKTQPFSRFGHVIELYWEYLSVQCIWLCYYRFTCAFQSKSTLYSWLNVKEFLAWNRRNIWSLNDYNGTLIQNLFVRKRTLSHLAKLAKWLSCVVSTYLYGAFDYMVKSLFVLFISITAFYFFPFSLIIWSWKVIRFIFWRSLNSTFTV